MSTWINYNALFVLFHVQVLKVNVCLWFCAISDAKDHEFEWHLIRTFQFVYNFSIFDLIVDSFVSLSSSGSSSSSSLFFSLCLFEWTSMLTVMLLMVLLGGFHFCFVCRISFGKIQTNVVTNWIRSFRKRLLLFCLALFACFGRFLCFSTVVAGSAAASSAKKTHPEAGIRAAIQFRVLRSNSFRNIEQTASDTGTAIRR